MDAKKKYITQLNARDMQEIAAAANSHGGDGIDVIPTETGLEFSVDRDWLTRCVRRIMNGDPI